MDLDLVFHLNVENGGGYWRMPYYVMLKRLSRSTRSVGKSLLFFPLALTFQLHSQLHRTNIIHFLSAVMSIKKIYIFTYITLIMALSLMPVCRIILEQKRKANGICCSLIFSFKNCMFKRLFIKNIYM